MNERTVIALGGNAISSPSGGTAAEQIEHVSQAMGPVAELLASGIEVVLTHGNGPQVGNLLIANELASAVVPALPLDWCVAQTQATIGYTIITALEHELAARGLARPIVPVLTRVLVDPDDAAWDNPAKPIGPFMTEAEARQRMAETEQIWKPAGVKGWRRVVPSPEPLQILDRGAIRLLLEDGAVVVAAGGGGIPMVWDDHGRLRGVEAVVDKDLTGARLAAVTRARRYVMLTDVPAVAIGFGGPGEEWLGTVKASALRQLQTEGHFAAGSMGPKVEAALRFVESTGGRAVIGPMDRASAVARGETGTEVVPG